MWIQCFTTCKIMNRPCCEIYKEDGHVTPMLHSTEDVPQTPFFWGFVECVDSSNPLTHGRIPEI